MKRKPNTYHQVAIDTRPQELKDRDFLHEELALGAAKIEYTTRAKARKEMLKYYAENQKSTSSCAAHSGALCLGIIESIRSGSYKRLSPSFIYRNRINYPEEGMIVANVGKIGKDMGTCLMSTLPTPSTETDINKIILTEAQKSEALQFRAGNYFSIYSKSIDEYARIANNLELPIALFVWGSVKEWSMEIPEVLDVKLTLDTAPVRHLVTILPNTAHIYRGKKYFIVQDSSPFGKKTHRYITEDWLLKRVVMGLYWLQLPPVAPLDNSKKFKEFHTDLVVGSIGPEVTRVQEFLKSQGYFPDMNCTEYFGGITYDAVCKFQEANRNFILAFFNMDKPNGKWLSRTQEAANRIINS